MLGSSCYDIIEKYKYFIDSLSGVVTVRFNMTSMELSDHASVHVGEIKRLFQS